MTAYVGRAFRPGVFICGMVLLLVVVVHAQDAGNRTVWDGVYTEAQAQRGGALYMKECASCHGEEMQAGAGAPSLAGPEFTFGWDKKPLGGLFDFVRANMPPGQAGSLKDQAYADILSAILRRNKFPVSPASELSSSKSELDKITLVADKP